MTRLWWVFVGAVCAILAFLRIVRPTRVIEGMAYRLQRGDGTDVWPDNVSEAGFYVDAEDEMRDAFGRPAKDIT